ncbi:hypothetical protein HZS_807 [Henneguya salminicola]|nr:hypothetical protein HZS_807 [Henneguya salminicola]
MTTLCLTELEFYYDAHICRMIEFSSNNDAIQKNIASFIYLIDYLKRYDIIGNQIDHQIDYIKMHTHKQCTQDDISWFKKLLKPDNITERTTFNLILDYPRNKISSLLALYYAVDWSVVQQDEITFVEIFDILRTFHKLQIMLIKDKYAKESKKYNLESIIIHLLHINHRLIDFFSLTFNENGQFLIEKICHHLTKKLNDDKDKNFITSDFIENKCKNVDFILFYKNKALETYISCLRHNWSSR